MPPLTGFHTEKGDGEQETNPRTFEKPRKMAKPIHYWMKVIARNIDRAMDKKGAKIIDIAREAGVNRATIGKIRTGMERNPSIQTLYALCESLGLDLNDLLEESGMQQEESPAPSFLTYSEMFWHQFLVTIYGNPQKAVGDPHLRERFDGFLSAVTAHRPFTPEQRELIWQDRILYGKDHGINLE